MGDESRIVRDTYENRKDSLFCNQYEKVLSEVNMVLPHLYVDMQRGNDNDKSSILVERTANNIFAFIGDRGSGKTSCMVSSIHMLNDVSRESIGYENLNDKRFHITDTIDPSFFDKKSNVLEIFIGKLFVRFKDVVRDDASSQSKKIQLKNKIYSEFLKVKSCISNIEKQNYDDEGDRVVGLERLADSVELRDAMQDLINSYLIYVEKDILVIPVDDMDHHTDCGYKMLEQIRKYLILKNTLIFIALRLDQMKRVIELEGAKSCQPLIEQKVVSREMLMEKASRYLTKLIPLSHRIYLPSMTELMDVPLEIYREDVSGKEVNNGKRWSIVKGSGFEKNSVKNMVSNAIFVKTRYLFYHSKGIVSPIVPTNLRDLRHLIGLLYDMEDHKGREQDYNKDLFEQYFFNSWATINIGQTGSEVVRDLLDVRDASKFNKTVLLSLKRQYGSLYLTDEFIDQTPEIKNILDDMNTSYNISLGDVRAILSYLKARVTSRFDISLLFAIETICSWKLDRYYQLKINEIFRSNEQQTEDDSKSLDKININDDIFGKVSQYNQLLGGTFINTKIFPLVAPDKNNKNRTTDTIDLNRIRELIKSIKPDSPEDEQKSETQKLKIAELLSLLIYHKVYRSKKSYQQDSIYRKSQDLVYHDAFSSRQVNVVFDLSCLFANLTDIKHCYDRVDENLFDYARRNKESLYSLLRDKAWKRSCYWTEEKWEKIECPKMEGEDMESYEARKSDKKEKEKDRRMLYWFSMRNMELIEDIANKIRYKTAASGDPIMNYVEFFKRLSGYKKLRYDRDDKGEFCTIDCSFADVFIEMLQDENVRMSVKHYLLPEVPLPDAQEQ